MTVNVHVPSHPLDAYIKCLWYAEGPVHYPRLKVLPAPSLHLMVNLGSPYQVYMPDQSEPFATCAESWSVGVWGAYHLMDMPLDMQVISVSFKPGGAYPFLQLPLSELHNWPQGDERMAESNPITPNNYHTVTPYLTLQDADKLIRTPLAPISLYHHAQGSGSA